MLGIFLDSETNGLNPSIHRVLEIAFKIVDLSTGEIKESYQTLVKQDLTDWKKSNPISLEINGFSFAEVSKGKTQKEVSKEIIAIFEKWDIERKKAVFICQNPSFDRVFFGHLIDPELQEAKKWPYHWLDLASMHWALCMKEGKTRPWDAGLSKDMIASFYKLPPEEKPHRAMNGVSHLLLCYQKIVGF